MKTMKTMKNAELYHHGILGMKWGVRRYQNKDGSLTPAGRKKYKTAKSVGKDAYILEKNVKAKDQRNYDLRKDNRKIGTVLVDEYRDHSHIDWIGVKEKERGKGYATNALKIVLNDSAKKGKKFVTLEAAGLDPSALHIYEKLGFKTLKSVDSDIWNGLVYMRKELKRE